ncbi:pyruvate oxidase [Bacillus tianshenii]|nr:pyruvate oxidase [Bacillus tianshenii]
MFNKRTGEIVVDRLKEWGVDHVYGLPGDSINELIEDLRKAKDDINFIQVRHEEVGALAAASYGKLTGRLGVCLSIAGPGAVHLMNGLYDAKADGAPVLVLVGQVDSNLIGTDAFQEINLERMFDDVAVYKKRVVSEEQLPDLMNQAIRTAYAKKGVSVLILPDDIIAREMKVEVPLTSSVKPKINLSPAASDLEKAVEMIDAADRPVILAGKGALKAREELLELTEVTGAPVIVSLPGKGAIPDTHPSCLGHLGQIGTKPSYHAMQETDLLIMVGTSFPYREFLPKEARAVQIDLDPTQIGKRYPIDLGLVGDAKQTLHWINGRISRKRDRSFLEKYQEKMQEWNHELTIQEERQEAPLQGPQVIHQLQKTIEKDAILSVDVGNVTVWMARHFKMDHHKMVISSSMATMGCGLPGAIAAKIAEPERQVVAVCGDGGFSMVMQDFITAVKYKLPIIVVILNNEKIGMIKYEQEAMGHLEYVTELGGMNFAAFAESCGGEGYRAHNYEELVSAFQKASFTSKPVIIDVEIEEIPPLPGKIGYSQAANYTKFMIKKYFADGKIELPSVKKSMKRLF